MGGRREGSAHKGPPGARACSASQCPPEMAANVLPKATPIPFCTAHCRRQHEEEAELKRR